MTKTDTDAVEAISLQDTQALDGLLRFHETGGHSGDGSDANLERVRGEDAGSRPMTSSKIEPAEGGVPEWAKKRAKELWAEWCEERYILDPFARYIAEHEEEPVDPLLIEARKICAADYRIRYPNVGDGTWPDHCINGAYDNDAEVQLTLAGLRRGIELAGEAK